MEKTAIVFPGQGAQYVGMGKELAEEFKVVRDTFAEANEALGYDLADICWEGPNDKLVETEVTQPAILTTSVAIWRLLEEQGFEFEIGAGLSLGEYSALVAAGALDFASTVQLVTKRGRYMQEAVPLGTGGMAAVIGLDKDTVNKVCLQAGIYGRVEPANFNSPGQIVISGEKRALEEAVRLAKEAGAKRAIVLAVSAPFHSSLMKPAAERLAEDLDMVSIHDAFWPIVSNVDALPVFDGQIIKPKLIQQVDHPVLWDDSVKTMIKNGVNRFIEVGPGTALSGFIKRIAPGTLVQNVEDLATLRKVLVMV